MHPSSKPQRLVLRDGQSLEVCNPHGLLQLLVTCEGGRTTVSLGSCDLRVATQGDVAFACRDFHVTATRKIALTGPQVHVFATVRDALIQAHDYVRLLGERIHLNTDHDPEADEQRVQSWVSKLIGRPPLRAPGRP